MSGFVLRLSQYADRFLISPSASSGTQTIEASILVANAELLDVDFGGRQYYSFLVCQLYVNVSIESNKSVNM